MEKINNPEVWKHVKGYEGLYAVSNHGNCKRLSRKFKHPVKNDALLKELILSNTRCNLGYVNWTFTKNGKRKTFKAHRLVALMFIENPENLRFINHINEVKSCNNIENLEWVSHRENISHRYKKVSRTSVYTGVFVDTTQKTYNKPYRASINIKGSTVHLGSFQFEEDAHQAYLKALENFNLKNKYANNA